MKPKRCKQCKKVLRSHNKSGYCHYHSVLYKKRIHPKCCLCGESCKEEMSREDIRKGATYYFCTYHFNYRMFATPKRMRELIKKAKKLLK